MPTPEEQRALEYQANERKRREFERSLQAKLKPDNSKRKQLLKNWDPLIRR